MRVLMVVHNYYPRDIRVRREAEAMVNAGHAVGCICLRDEGERPRERVHGVEVYRLPVRRHRESGLFVYLLEYLQFAFLAFFRANALLFRHRHRILHVHNPPDFLLLLGLPARLLLGTRLVLDVHDLTSHLFSSRFAGGKPGWKDRLINAQENLCLRLADQVVTVHEDYRRLLREKGLPEGKIHVTMNCPDDRLFDRSRFNGLEPPAERFVLVYHGLLARRAGVDLLVRAAARLRGEIPGLELGIYGWGPLEPELRRLRSELAVTDTVRLEGKVPWDDIPAILMQSHLGCAPNRMDLLNRYAFNNKILECVAMGLPVVASRSEALERYFEPDQIEFVAPGDLEALVESIRRLYADPARRAVLAEGALRFHETHRWARQAAELVAVMERLGGEAA